MAPEAHPQLQAIQAMLAARGLKPADPVATPLAEARAAAFRYHAVWNEDVPAVNAIAQATIASPGGALPIRLYYPFEARGDLPVLLYFHGGGFVLNGPDTHDRLLRLLALRSGAVVAALSYRLAPETRFPGQIDDALAALDWLRSRSGNLGISGERLAVGGDSAGATLALALMLALKGRGLPQASFGLLLYGMFSARLDTPSHRKYGGGAYGLTTERVDWFWRQYLADDGQRDNPLAAPLHADLSGLPPQLVIGAGLDCLLDDSLDLDRALRQAGVETALTVYDGVPHAFMPMSAYLDPADQAITEAALAVAHHLRMAGDAAQAA